MAAVTYASSPHSVRRDLADAHLRAWDRLAEPGTWLDGATRVAVAAATREAQICGLCRLRKQSVSPNAHTGPNTGPNTGKALARELLPEAPAWRPGAGDVARTAQIPYLGRLRSKGELNADW